MTNQYFCYWLQGFFELRTDRTAPLTASQVEIIARQIDLCAEVNTLGPGAGAIKALLLITLSAPDVATRAIEAVLADVFQIAETS